MVEFDLASFISNFSIQSLRDHYHDPDFIQSISDFSLGNAPFTIDGIDYSLLKSQDVEPSSNFIAEIFSQEIPVYKWLNITPRENLLGFIYGWCYKGNWEICSVIANHQGDLVGALQACDPSTAPDYPIIPDEVSEYRDKEYPLWRCAELSTPSWIKDHRIMSDNLIAVKTNQEGKRIGSKLLALSMCLAAYHGYEYYCALCVSDASSKMHSHYMEMNEIYKFEDVEKEGEKPYVGCPGGFVFGWAKLIE